MLARTEEMLRLEKAERRKATLEILRLRVSLLIILFDAETDSPSQQELERERSGSRGSTVGPMDDDTAPDATQTNMKIEDVNNTTHSSFGIKRECDEEKGEVQELAPPPKRTAIVIDLTDDD